MRTVAGDAMVCWGNMYARLTGARSLFGGIHMLISQVHSSRVEIKFSVNYSSKRRKEEEKINSDQNR